MIVHDLKTYYLYQKYRFNKLILWYNQKVKESKYQYLAAVLK